MSKKTKKEATVELATNAPKNVEQIVEVKETPKPKRKRTKPEQKPRLIEVEIKSPLIEEKIEKKKFWLTEKLEQFILWLNK